MGSYVENQELPSSRARYWQNYLEDVGPCYFPKLTDGIDTDRQLERREQVRVDIRISGAPLAKFCQHQNVMVAEVLQTVWAVVLGRYIGSEEICFGTAIHASSNGGETTYMVSRARLGSEDPISKTLSDMQESLVRGLPHACCSLADIQKMLPIEQPLFNSTISLRSDDGEVREIKLLKDLKAYDALEVSIGTNQTEPWQLS
jgi:hypothetical protein